MTDKDKITIKYHKHLEGNEPESMVYFTREDVHKCMSEYLASVSNWVAVKDQMPPVETYVIVYNGSHVFDACYDEVIERWYDGESYFDNATHWMPLPNPPCD